MTGGGIPPLKNSLCYFLGVFCRLHIAKCFFFAEFLFDIQQMFAEYLTKKHSAKSALPYD
jgi:hypothetical protein